MKKLKILSEEFLSQLSEQDVSPLSRAAMSKLSGGYKRATATDKCIDECEIDEHTGEATECKDIACV